MPPYFPESLAPSPAPDVSDQGSSAGIPMPRRGDLYLHQWLHPQPIGKLLMLHGKGDHGGRFAELGVALQQIGWSCYAPDMWGFGRSPGPRCWMWGFNQIQADLEILQQTLSPQIWGGYSTGAIWALEYTLNHPQQVQGLVLISPALRIDNHLTPLSQRLLPFINVLLPQWVVSRGYRPMRVTSVPQRQQELWEDPWVEGTTRVRFVAELMQAGRRCLERASQLSVPILVLYSPQDQIINPEGTEEFITALRSTSVPLTVQRFPNSRHDLLHDIDHLQVKQQILTWLQQWSDP